MNLYNTLSKKVEKFIPINEKEVTLYTCGPTVYHYAHIGNLRSYISEDILEKALSYIGYKVKRCMNITDVGHLTSDSDSGEDKMLKGAKREGKTVLEIADYYTDCFRKDTQKLNIKWPEIVSKATDNIDMYIKIIETLLAKDFAYQSGGNIYFDTTKLQDYYALTNHKIDDMVVGVRDGVEEDLNKRNQADFVLWFTKSKFDSQELKWNSPWGLGYPGWHIECTGISLKNLGEYLDIHCGGVDNIFPHHTNEIAQSEAYLGHKWCNYWFHTEHLNDETGKMSKSKGEFLTLSLLEEKGYNPLVYRFLCLQSHYRKPMLFSYANLDNATNAYEKLLGRTRNLKKEGTFTKESFDEYVNLFKDCLKDDLNTSSCLTIVYDVLKDKNLTDFTKRKIITSFDQVLSLDLLKETELKLDQLTETYIQDMIAKRNDAKRNKDFAKADQIRDELKEKGIIIKDTREGTIFELK